MFVEPNPPDRPPTGVPEPRRFAREAELVRGILLQGGHYCGRRGPRTGIRT
jgi:hypothetical protein